MSDEVLHRLNAHFGPPVHFVDVIQYQSNDIQALVELVRTSDIVFFGVLQVAQPLIQRGELVRVNMRPILELSSQFVFVTLEGKTLPPALARVQELCVKHMSNSVNVEI